MAKKQSDLPSGGWDQNEGGGGWDDVYPLDESDDSSDDGEMDHDFGTAEYQENVLTRKIRQQLEENQRNQPVVPRPSWRDYVQTAFGDTIPSSTTTDYLPVSRTDIPENEPFQRSAGRQMVINHALACNYTLGQLGEMRANPLMEPMRTFETAGSELLLDMGRRRAYTKRILDPAEESRRLLKAKQWKERKEREERERRPRGAPAARKSAAAPFANRRLVGERMQPVQADDFVPAAPDLFDGSE